MKKLILLFVSFITLLSTNAQKYRLDRILVERYDSQSNQYIPDDSIDYYYSNGRGGHIPNKAFYHGHVDSPDYGQPVTVYTADASRAAYSPRVPMGYKKSLLYDSALLHRRSMSLNVPYAKRYNFISNNRVDSAAFMSGYDNVQGKYSFLESQTYLYDNNGRKSELKWYSGGPNPDEKRYVYNNNGTLDSVIGTFTDAKYLYSSNGIQLMEINRFSPDFNRVIFTYNMAGLPSSVLWIIYPASTPGPDTIDMHEYTYDANNNMIRDDFYSFKKHTSYVGKHIIYTVGMTYNNKDQRIVDSLYYDFEIHSTPTGLLKAARRKYGYNSYGLIDEYEVQYWDSTAKVWSVGGDMDSLYGPAHKLKTIYSQVNSVPEYVQNKASINVYPLPAYNIITVKAELKEPEPFEVVIYNMQGVIIKKWNEGPVSQYSRTISTDDIPAGTYIIRLQGKNTHAAKQIVLID